MRNLKLKQFVYELGDYLPPHVRGVVMPPSKYLVTFADYLNHILLFSGDVKTFSKMFKDDGVPATEQEIDSAF